MTVHELTRDQLDELKTNYFWSYIDCYSDDETFTGPDPRDYGYPENIPDAVVFEVYAGFHFVNDDFSCSVEIPLF